MMHIEAIIERNKRPSPQPSSYESEFYAWHSRNAVEGVRDSKRPWDAPDPMPEAEAHPR